MSKELAKTYDPKGIEDRLYKKWMDNGYFHAKVNPDKKPFTIVMPPPNVTGQLHMGHALDEHHAGYPDPLQEDGRLRSIMAARY